LRLQIGPLGGSGEVGSAFDMAFEMAVPIAFAARGVAAVGRAGSGSIASQSDEVARAAESRVSPTLRSGPGSLRIDFNPQAYSQSEIRAAEFMKARGNNVVLRPPTGTRAGGKTYDLVVNGTNYDVLTPVSPNQNSVFRSIRNKNDQARGIVVDLSETSVTEADLGNVMARLKGAGADNIREVVFIPK